MPANVWMTGLDNAFWVDEAYKDVMSKMNTAGRSREFTVLRGSEGNLVAVNPENVLYVCPAEGDEDFSTG